MNDRTKELLADLLLRWEQLHDRGQDTPATELAKEHPELIPELERRIKLLKKIAWLDKPLDDDPPEQGGPTGRPPASPRTLAGRYRLDELIAEGGFAQVFRAFDQELQRTVAVKLPKPGRLHATDEFLAEARRAARLKHDGIVPVHDVGTDGDACFIVTEYLEGGSLADRMANGRPSRKEAIRWIAEVADALEHAHCNGVIHRDLKPGNILIDQHERAKLADFGIAQAANTIGQSAPSLGTLAYMAPETLGGKTADVRSDLYSLAVVLYELVTGRMPYSSSEPNTLRKEIVRGPSPTWEHDLPTTLRSICRKALSKSPQQRQASAAQFATELRQADRFNPWNVKTIGAAMIALGLVSVATARYWPQASVADSAVASTVALQDTEDDDSLKDPPARPPVVEEPNPNEPLPAEDAPMRQRVYIPIPSRDRVFVPPETVGVEKDCPFPTVKDRLTFQCPKCNLKGFTHVLYPHLPHCPKDTAVMLEVPPLEAWQHWAGDKDIAFIYDKQLHRWKEQTRDDPPSCFFDETDRTPWYVELKDPLRNVSIRIYENHAKYREDDDPWVLLRGGKWITASDK